MLKKILQNPIAQWLLATIACLYIALVYVTSRKVVEGAEHPNLFWRQKQPVIIAIWHGRLLLGRFLMPWRIPFNALISQSRDGQFIAKVAKILGGHTIAGSSSKGGSAALRQCVRKARQGENIFITPDGPRGPRMRCAMGTVELAKLSGLPIIPTSISYSAGKRVKSWDRFFVPRPFSTVYIKYGEAAHVPAKAQMEEKEAIRQQVEKELTRLQNSLDTQADLPVIEPQEPKI